MRNKRTFLLAVVLSTSFLAILLGVSRPVLAQSAGPTQAHAQIRRTVDPSPRGVKGSILFVENGAQQSLTVNLKSLPEPDLYVHLSTNSFYDGTNSPVYVVAPLDRTSRKRWNWFRKLTGTNGAPPELQAIDVVNLSDLSDLRCIVIGNPGTTNIIGGTNYYDCVQTVTNDQTIITCVTNVVGGQTNLYINAYAWAPVPPLVSNATMFSFVRKTKLQRPDIPPSPKATGTMRLSYNGPKGQSQLDIQASGLISGQNYALWVSDGGSNVAAGDFVLTPGGTHARFNRQTRLGDPLPLQAASTADLTDRVFMIHDAFGRIHLQGSFP